MNSTFDATKADEPNQSALDFNDESSPNTRGLCRKCSRALNRNGNCTPCDEDESESNFWSKLDHKMDSHDT